MENKEIAFLSGPHDRLSIELPQHLPVWSLSGLSSQWLMADGNYYH